MVLGLVVVHLYYVNVPLVSLPEVDISQLQKIQTLAAKLVLRQPQMDSATPSRGI